MRTFHLCIQAHCLFMFKLVWFVWFLDFVFDIFYIQTLRTALRITVWGFYYKSSQAVLFWNSFEMKYILLLAELPEWRGSHCKRLWPLSLPSQVLVGQYQSCPKNHGPLPVSGSVRIIWRSRTCWTDGDIREQTDRQTNTGTNYFIEIYSSLLWDSEQTGV